MQKTIKKILIIFLSLVLLTGCGGRIKQGKCEKAKENVDLEHRITSSINVIKACYLGIYD